MKRFEDKTGGNQGIDYAMAERFAEEGANLVIASIDEKVHDAAAKLRATGARPCRCFATSPIFWP